MLTRQFPHLTSQKQFIHIHYKRRINCPQNVIQFILSYPSLSPLITIAYIAFFHTFSSLPFMAWISWIVGWRLTNTIDRSFAIEMQEVSGRRTMLWIRVSGWYWYELDRAWFDYCKWYLQNSRTRDILPDGLNNAVKSVLVF